MNNYTHLFHPYPAKFPPQVIKEFIEQYTNEKDLILDPFCGSGTALVEARLLNRNAIGIELNPIGALISKSKSEFYNKKDIIEIEKIINDIVNIKSKDVTDVLPNYQNRDYWFKDFVINELNSIKYIIDKKKATKKIYNLLLTAFSKIIVQVSNQDAETRYACVEKGNTKGDTTKIFVKTLNDYIKAINKNLDVINKSEVRVIEGDALSVLGTIKKNTVDLVVTSPPYINSFDYYLYHKHRLFLLGKNPLYVRKNEIGGHHTIDTQTYDKAYNNYYSALEYVFTNVHNVLRDKKKFILLIGDGIVKGRVINIDKVMLQMAVNTGFSVIDINTMPLSNVSKTFIKGKNLIKKNHHVIILEKRK